MLPGNQEQRRKPKGRKKHTRTQLQQRRLGADRRGCKDKATTRPRLGRRDGQEQAADKGQRQ
eukprot:12558696-Alexandrium_andersonii.AAC.1